MDSVKSPPPPPPPSNAVATRLLEGQDCGGGRKIEVKDTDPADLPVYEPIKSSRRAKSRIIKHKRCQDRKNADKKILKACGKNKYNPFVTVPGLLHSESVSGGSNRLGICSLKLDSCDVTRHLNEPSLDELLDGSYKYSNICTDNGKKSPHIGESTLLSVRKACDVLSGMKGITNGEISMSIPSFNSYGKKVLHSDNVDKHMLEEAASSGKGLGSLMKDTCNSLLQPKNILNQLSLPPSPDLDTIIQESNVTSLSMKSMRLKTKMSGASLPPFPWSFCHSGSSKPCIDLGKSASTRNMCQSRWLKIESNFAIGFDKSCFTKLDLEEYFCNRDSSDQLKVEDFPIRQLTDKINPVKNTSIPNSHALHENMLCQKNEKQVNDHKFGYGEQAANVTKHAEVVSRSLRVKPHLDDLYGTNGKGRSMLGTCGSSRTFYHDSSINATSGSHKKYSILPQTSKEELSPRCVVAAETLCLIGGDRSARRARHDDRVKFRRPRSPQQKVVEACPPISGSSKADRLLPSARHQDHVKSTDMTARCKLTSEKSSTCTQSIDVRGRVRWSSSPSKSERDPLLRMQSFDGFSVRKISTPSPLGTEKGFGLPHHRIRKPSTDASVNLGVTSQIKDWSRGRLKRM